MGDITIGGSTSSTLFIVFLVLKLTKVIDWSWWWITAPLWIPLLIFLVIILVISCIGFIAYILNK